MTPIEVGVLGGTGMVGQHFIRFLEGHPWFKLTWLGASDRSAGKKFSDATQWRLDGELPSSISDIVVSDCHPKSAPRLVFSAMDASVATEIEQAFARAGSDGCCGGAASAVTIGRCSSSVDQRSTLIFTGVPGSATFTEVAL